MTLCTFQLYGLCVLYLALMILLEGRPHPAYNEHQEALGTVQNAVKTKQKQKNKTKPNKRTRKMSTVYVARMYHLKRFTSPPGQSFMPFQVYQTLISGTKKLKKRSNSCCRQYFNFFTLQSVHIQSIPSMFQSMTYLFFFLLPHLLLLMLHFQFVYSTCFLTEEMDCLSIQGPFIYSFGDSCWKSRGLRMARWIRLRKWIYKQETTLLNQKD